MKIEDLQVTAQLAHLNMDEKELAAAFPAFEQMLGFFAAMQVADRDSEAFPEAALAAASTADHFRPDTLNPNNFHNTSSNGLNDETLVSRTLVRRTLVRNLLNNAGDRDGRFIVVPNVL
jgi:aspartyl-tRNA(Asn)/glutamyl-tRNA(Gln) amidotransferase subunit C